MFSYLERFVTEFSLSFFYPMWPLLVLASALQVYSLFRQGIFHDSRAWKVGFVVLLSPLLAVFLRFALHIHPVEDYFPFAQTAGVTGPLLAITSNTLYATVLAYGFLSWVAYFGRE